tara:strand:+ start:162 stop:380 length:219 start_codon:yes stop_codon:yes gene_type:complete
MKICYGLELANTLIKVRALLRKSKIKAGVEIKDGNITLSEPNGNACGVMGSLPESSIRDHLWREFNRLQEEG